jgi:3-phenylpropionate/cinnamic acid dioxygenase small subunit
MMGNFAEDAVLEVGDRTVTGRDSIFEFFGGGSSSDAATERTKHVVTNTIVAAEAGELLVTSYFQVLRSWGIANWGRYEDRMAAADGTWQIVRRKVVVDGQVARPPRPADSAAPAR